MSEQPRFSTLDAMRGVAALGVMLWHTPGQPVPARGGYLMVDLFFALSGFVIALSYEEQLRNGMAARHFLALRAARLWPMIVLGSMISMVLAHAWMGMAFLLPDPRTHTLFPANPPFWSLLMEAAAYAAFAAAAPHATARRAAAAALVCGAGLALCVFVTPPLHAFGSYWSTAPQGLLRTGYSFCVGVLVYRLRPGSALVQRGSRWAWVLPAALTPIALLMPLGAELGGLLIILFVMPGLLWLGTRWSVGQGRLVRAVCNLSFPLYCIHMPLLWLGDRLGVHHVIMWAVLVVLSLALERWWDRPMRRLLRERVEQRFASDAEHLSGEGAVLPQ